MQCIIEKICSPISQLYLFVLIFGILSCSLWGQDSQKKQLMEGDFNQWEILREPILSKEGDWVSYRRGYLENKDTLVVTNVRTKVNFKFPDGTDATFLPGKSNLWFICNVPNKGVGILNLSNGNIQWIMGAQNYVIAPDGQRILCTKNRTANEKSLFFLRPGEKSITTIEGIVDFKVSPSGRLLAYSRRGNTSEIVISDWSKTIKVYNAKRKNQLLHHLIWHPDEISLSFLQHSTDPASAEGYESIVNWNLAKGSSSILDPSSNKLLRGLRILSNLFYYSTDGSKLIFNVSPTSIDQKIDETLVQVWKGTDPWLYPRVENTWEWENQWWKTVWCPTTGKLLQLGNEITPQVEINPNEKFAIVYNKYQYGSDEQPESASDLYAVNLNTGEKVLIVKKQETPFRWLQISPTGNFLSYFTSGQWWVYNFQNRTNICLTSSIKSRFFSINTTHSSKKAPYGNPGWTLDDRHILLYDEFDLWAISTDGSHSIRLTDGVTDGTEFRIDNYADDQVRYGRSIFGTYEYDLKNNTLPLLGFKKDIPVAHYQTDLKGSKEIFSVQYGKIRDLKRAKNDASLIYIQESAEHAPALFYLDTSIAGPIKLYQSNKQEEQYSIGRTERFTFRTPAEQELAAILHFPDQFDPAKKYPMIVHIYEKQSQDYADYIVPTYYEYEGFNSRVYTSNGYFVLEPDIAYLEGDPGISALQCVENAVKEVLYRYPVDKEKIGLIGHSFGGFETTFIIGQTDIFHAAVAGSAVTDLTSYYFSLSAELLQPEFWRFENQQWRMGFNYFANRYAYLANSPLHSADQISCPLLLWAGGEDKVIPYRQSVELYLALRRMGREVTFLLYPEENHALMESKNQYDLSIRIKDFFDKNLK